MKKLYTLTVLLVSLLSSHLSFGQCDVTLSNSTPCALEEVTFSVDTPSGSYAWDLDFDGFIDAFGASTTYAFPESMIDLNYSVILYLNGTVCETIDVFVAGLPDPSIGVVPGSGILEGNLIRVCSGSPAISLEIYNTSTTYNNNTNYEINWGDGTIENYDNTTFPNTNTITHDYTTYGYYNMSFTTTATNGCTNTIFYTLYNGSNPSVGLANPGNTVGICAPATIDFPITNTASNPTGTIYTLYVSGEVVALYTQENVPGVFSYTFEESSCGQSTSTGNYQNAYDVQILASNPCGSSQATIEPIELSSPPEVLFVSDDPSNGCEEQTYTFTNASGNLAEVIAGTCTSLTPSWTITPGVPGVHWEIISGNTFASEEIEIIFLIPGVYEIEMTINSPSCGSGTYSNAITIFEGPDAGASGGLITASVPATSDECLPSIGVFSNESSGDSLNYEWDVSPSTGWEFIDTFNFNSEDLQVMFTEPGEYNVSLSANNFCESDIWDTLLVVVDVPVVNIPPIPNQCGSATFDFDASMVDINANFGVLSSIEWSFPGAVPATSSSTYPTNIFYENTGVYTVEVTVVNQCGSHTATQTFEIEAIGSVSVSDDVEICENGAPFTVTGTPTGGTWTGNGVSANGDFDPSNSTAGDNVLIYSFQDGACLLQDSLVVTINPLPNVDAGEDQSACVDAAPFVISGGTPVGGTWTVNNGGVIIGGNSFDPVASGAGVFTLTYNYTGVEDCAGSDSKMIVVNELPIVDAGPNQSICENPFGVELTGASPSGGTWSGPGIDANGMFNASSVGQGGYTLYYDFTNPVTGCYNIDSMIMTVTPNIPAEAGPAVSYCNNVSSFEITNGTPAGGVWTGQGVDSLANVFDPEIAGIGTHTLTYTIGQGECQTQDTTLVTIFEIPTLTLPNGQLLCINDLPYELNSATPAGGTWTGTGINGDLFDPSIAGVGTHSITYSYSDPVNGCPNSETIEMEVLPLPNIVVSDTTYCNTPGIVDLPIASPSGGDWSGIGVVGNTFDPAEAGGVGVYTVVYTYADKNNCENSEDVIISVIEPDDIDAGNDFEICIDAADVDLSQIASPAGGTWNANGSLGLNGTLFNPSQAGLGTHTLTYTIGEGNCQVFDEIEITVNPLPVVNTMENFEICASESNVMLTANPVGGTWVANNNGVLVGDAFNASASGEGVYAFTYTYIDENGCQNSDDLLITVFGLPEITTNDTTYCYTPGLVSLPNVVPSGGLWSGQGVSNGMFDPQAAGGAGVYTVSYTYSDANGCENTASSDITIIPPADIDAGMNDTLCIDDLAYQLVGFMPANGTWSGAGIVDAQNGIFNPSIAGPGNHVITYSFGVGNCYVEDTKVITVIDLQVEAGPDEASCFTYEPFLLDGYSPLGGTWTGTGITNGNTGEFDPTVSGNGTFVLTYSYTDPISGCEKSDSKSITIHPMEEAAFNLPPIACRNELVQFENLSPSNYGMYWNFGIGSGNSTAVNPTYTYTVAGLYTVTLIVENEFGCIDTVAHDILIADTPEAYFVPDTTEGCVNNGFAFNNQSFGDSLSYLWEFGDFQTSTDEDPGVIYFEQGAFDTTYLVSLTVSNICGSHTYQDLILIHPSPNASFGIAPLTECSPLLVDFANASTGAASEFLWDFGNGNTSTQQIPPTQTYFTDLNFSTYTVTLIATNLCGSDTSSTEVVVESANVVAAAEASILSGCLPLTVDFTNFSSATATIDWVFGDGNTSSQTDPSHTFTEAGEYSVIQYANSDCGYDTTVIDITVYPAPLVGFNHPEQACTGTEIQFNNTSLNTSGNFWDFGDGNTSNLNNPVHVYDAPGEYTVTLNGVSASNQCDGLYTSIVTVLALPVASFEPSTTYGCAPLHVDFVNHSTGALFYQWDFGDGNTSIDESPSHVFEEEGTYEVTMMATDGNGCFEDFTIYNIIVTPKPTAIFDYEKDASCGLPAVIYFENMSEGAIDYEWNFGEGTTSPFTDPTHTFTAAGIYEVTLIANNQFGCSDTSTLNIEIFEDPLAGIEIESMSGCEPLEVQFNNTSSHSNNYLWDFGDGTTSTESDPFHVYTEHGSYEVTLIANVNSACSDTIELSEIITVHPSPFANFETFQVGGDGTYELTNMSENADTYYWEFSDGATSDLVNPEHRFLTNGVHQLYLEASNEHGCVDDTLVSFVPDFVKGLFLPNGFSPEQGIGDVRLFRPKGIGIKEYHIQVFSTYGQLLWESKELDDQGRPTESWDGIVDGRMMPQDVYVWKCTAIFKDGSNWGGVKDKKGHYKTIGSLVLLR